MDPYVWLGALLGTLSCVAYAAAAVSQWRLAVLVPEPLIERGPLASLLARPLWWTSILLNGGRAAFQVAALAFAPLTVVQPLGVLALVFAIPWATRLGGRRLTRRQTGGAVLVVASVAVLLSLSVTDGRSDPLTVADGWAVTLGTLALLTAGAWAAGRCPAAWRSHLLAAVAGVAFGVSSALAKTTVTVIGTDGAAALAHPAATGTAVVAVLGMFLAQAAYQGMELGSPLGVTTVVNPVAASFVAIAFMGESFLGGPIGLVPAVLAAAGCAYGISLLTARLPAPAAHPA
ncbi:DMT family transporter [Nocardiopsis changdeensis]|uniref:DMT family transporter n=1 Tax=Nocardiopsis changdeensis TaxID=2831969 RepID=A0ABX8BMC9_9ACTN|nr:MULTISPECIES: DMT family transporter [Nocardiopsis]QUX23402.1 DMT family transporter [Nocardiopsis changdeensis]QYX39344.1 DMT family transporter [Nocardiopsis sp. MT53]